MDGWDDLDFGYISFNEMVTGVAKFHGCTTTHDFAFRLLDANMKGTVPKSDVLLVIRSVLGGVMKERSGGGVG